MSQHLEISQILDAVRRPGTLPQASQHLLECLECRQDLIALETLQAVALEAAPQPAASLLHQAAETIRQEALRERLAAQQGDEIARQVFSRRPSSPSARGGKLVLTLFLLAGLFGGAWWYFHLTSETLPYDQHTISPPPLPGPDEPQAWESVAEIPTAEPLAPRRPSRPVPSATPADTSKREKEIDRTVKSMLKRHLRDAGAKRRASRPARATPTPTTVPSPVAPKPSARPKNAEEPETFVLSSAAGLNMDRPVGAPEFTPQPSATPTQKPTLRPTRKPTAKPTAVPTKRPTPKPSPRPTARPSPVPSPPRPTPLPRLETRGPADETQAWIAPLRLSRKDRQGLRIRLLQLEKSGVEIRVFDPLGKTLRLLHDGPSGPGPVEFTWDLKDEQGSFLPAGSYYLRVLSPTVSRVESVELLP